MRYTHLFLFQILILLFSCSREKNKDFSEVNILMEITDSLLNCVQSHYDITNEDFYRLIDDSLYVDSIFKNKGLSKSPEFYQNLEQCRTECENIFAQTKKEIFFMQEQIKSLKAEYAKNKMIDTDYQKEIIELKELILFLEERVNSNIHIIDEKSNFYGSFNNTGPL